MGLAETGTRRRAVEAAVAFARVWVVDKNAGQWRLRLTPIH